MTRRLPVILPLVHALLVALTAVAIVASDEPDWPMAWTLFLFLDFPVSVLLFVINQLGIPSHASIVAPPTSAINDVANFVIPLSFFASLGTAWWLFLGLWLSRRRRAHNT